MLERQFVGNDSKSLVSSLVSEEDAANLAFLRESMHNFKCGSALASDEKIEPHKIWLVPPGDGQSDSQLCTKFALSSIKEQSPKEVEQVKDDDFAAKAENLISRIGVNGRVNRNDLSKALQDPSYTGEDAQIIAALYQNFDRLKVVGSNGRWFDESISAEDLAEYHKIQQIYNRKFSEAIEAKSWTELHFTQLDKNGNGALSHSELSTAKLEPATTGMDKTEIDYLLSHFKKLRNEEEIKSSDIDAYFNSLLNENDGSKLTLGVWSSCFKVHENQIAHYPKSLYASKDPLLSIVPDAIKQGSIGDCYFLAPLASIANSEPETIARSIHDNGNGTFTVRFAACPNEPITVGTPSEAEMGLFNHAGPYGVWASVMEKAYGAFCQRYFWRRSIDNLITDGVPESAADGGGFMEYPLALISGRHVDWHLVNLCSEQKMAQLLESALCGPKRKAVSVGINRDFFSDYTSDGFYRRHVYSVLNFIPASKGSEAQVVVRNPWGGKADTPDGVIRIPLKSFMQDFSRMAVVQ